MILYQSVEDCLFPGYTWVYFTKATEKLVKMVWEWKNKARYKYKWSTLLQAIPHPGKFEWKNSKVFLSLIHILWEVSLMIVLLCSQSNAYLPFIYGLILMHLDENWTRNKVKWEARPDIETTGLMSVSENWLKENIFSIDPANNNRSELITFWFNGAFN